MLTWLYQALAALPCLTADPGDESRWSIHLEHVSQHVDVLEQALSKMYFFLPYETPQWVVHLVSFSL